MQLTSGKVCVVVLFTALATVVPLEAAWAACPDEQDNTVVEAETNARGVRVNEPGLHIYNESGVCARVSSVFVISADLTEFVEVGWYDGSCERLEFSMSSRYNGSTSATRLLTSMTGCLAALCQTAVCPLETMGFLSMTRIRMRHGRTHTTKTRSHSHQQWAVSRMESSPPTGSTLARATVGARTLMDSTALIQTVGSRGSTHLKGSQSQTMNSTSRAKSEVTTATSSID